MSFAIDTSRARELLDVQLDEIDGADSGATTVREYLLALLRMVWTEREMFSGKRPFGNSSWEYDLYRAMGKAGFIEITLDSDGYIDTFPKQEHRKADALVSAAIDELGRSE